MFTFYWLYEKEDNWLVVFKTDNNYTVVNNRESLKKALSSIHYLVSYGNYKNSDKFLAKVLSNGKSSYLQEHLSIDLCQEGKNCTIEEIGFYLRMDMKSKSIEEFCKKRIAICEIIFSKREEYFETKFEIIKEFHLPARFISKTRANLAAEVLQAKKIPNRPNKLLYNYDQYVPKHELPERLLKFYDKIKTKYQNNFDDKLKKERFRMTLANLTHVYGFGGLHAAKEKYKGHGVFLLIDVKQFFPSIILNNHFLSAAIKNPEAFADLYQMKVNTGKATYKTLINSVNGSMNNPYSVMYDPQKYFSVTVSGQLIITHLILVLEGFFEELIQTNTDGILIKINPDLEQLIREILILWCQQLHLTVTITKIKKVFQRDVNNYVFFKEDNSSIRKGIFSESNYDSNNLPVVSKGIYESVVNNIKPQDFVIACFKKSSIEDFYFVGKCQGDFEGVEHQMISGYKKVNNTICGIATNNSNFGGIYQVKKDLHSKLPGSPKRFMSSTQANKKDIDTSWYVEQIEKNNF